jgi:hypothetical protein
MLVLAVLNPSCELQSVVEMKHITMHMLQGLRWKQDLRSSAKSWFRFWLHMVFIFAFLIGTFSPIVNGGARQYDSQEYSGSTSSCSAMLDNLCSRNVRDKPYDWHCVERTTQLFQEWWVFWPSAYRWPGSRGWNSMWRKPNVKRHSLDEALKTAIDIKGKWCRCG